MESLKWIAGYLKNHIPKYSIALILVLITSLLSMINPFLAGDIIDRVLNGNEKNILIPILITMLVVVVIKGVLTYIYQMIFEKVSQDILLNIRKDLYSKLLKLDFDYYNNTKTGDIMARMTGDTDALRHFIAWVVYNILSNLSVFIFAIISMAIVSLPLTLFMIAICPIIAIITIKMGVQISPTFYNIRESYSRLNSVTQENISGNRVVKAFSREDYEIEKFNKENLNYKEKNMDTTRIIGKYIPALEYLSSFLSIIMILVGGVLVINNSITLGDLVIFNGLLWALNNPMRMAGYLINDTERFIASSIKIRELLNTESNIKNSKAPIKAERIHGDILFDNVSFNYEDTAALKNVSFEAKCGQTIGIIGPTGSGKSTLVNNISTIDIPTNGSLYILNQEVKQMSENQLGKFRYQYLGFVFQNYNLLNSLTIYENIMIPLKLIGEDKKVIDEKVHQITKELDIESLLNKYPHECSGGQQQRVAIARALIGNPKIIIADEPTGNLDSQNSHEILSIFKKMNENHITIIMVSHDPLIASYSSRLLYLKDGKIEKELFKGDKTQQEYFKEIVSINSKEMQKMLD